MTIPSALTNALSGLRANAKLIEVTSNNLANALTEGYGRQTVDLGARVIGGGSNGVVVRGIDRALDPELSALRREADGDLAQERVVSDGLTRLGALYGQSSEPGKLFDSLTRFEAALRQLGETPESGPRQAEAAQTARDLADSFNQISTETTRLRQSTDAEINRQVDQVNDALRRIARLNRQVQIFAANGQDTASLIDERERLIDRVAQIIPIRESRLDTGVVEIRTAQGLPLADLRPRQLSFTPTPVLTPFMRYAAGTGALSGITLGTIDVTPGGPGVQRVDGRALAGLFELRDRVIPEAQTRLDTMAGDLIQRVSAPGVDPTLAATDPGLFTDAGGLYDPTDPTGLAARLSLNALADTLRGGDPSLLRDGLGATTPGPTAGDTIPRNLLDALAAKTSAATTPGLGGLMTASERLGAIIEFVQSDRVASEARTATLKSARETLAMQEAGKLGVNQDDELQNLIRIEQAYAANARVIQTASDMLDRLLQL